MIDYDDLDEMYEGVPTMQSIRPSTKPVGSLTDNRRKVKPNRDGARARVNLNTWRQNEAIRQYFITGAVVGA
jgi:hypothetical protein